MENVLTLVSLLGTALSFMGLCGLVRRWTKLDGTVAPLTAACGIIVALMLCGMAGLLAWGWRVLFAAGLIGFGWRYIFRREKPDLTALFLVAAFAAYGILRFRHAAFTGNDSVSHWGMVVKCLLRLDRFPDDASQLIYFQSYPMGTGVLIYYFTRLFGEAEGNYMAAQLMLHVFAYLPVFGLIKRNRGFGWPVALGSLLYLLVFDTKITVLQVDVTLALMTVGGLAIAVENRDSLARTLAGLVPLMVALVFVKQSGALFAAALALAAMILGRDGGARRRGIRALIPLIAGAAAIGAAFFTWQLYARATYAGVSASKHALSLSRFAQLLSGKDRSVIRAVAVGLARRVLLPGRQYWVPLFLAALALGGSALLIRLRARDRALWYRRLWRTALACAISYIVWIVMLFFMYVLSMPAGEARRLESINRYEGTGIACVMGMVVIFMLRCFCAEDFDFGSAKWPATGAALAAAGMLVLFGTGSLTNGPLRYLAGAPGRTPSLYPQVARIAESGQVEEERSYLVLTMHDELQVNTAIYAVKYYFFSNDIMAVSGHITHDDYDYDSLYSFRNTYGVQSDVERVEDLAGVLEKYADQYDYILVCTEAPVFDEALAAWNGDTPVIRGY